MSKIIFHVDANSAFLSWSAAVLVRDGKPDPRLIPAVVGGHENSRHGIVLAKSIPAKKLGIVTGEPIFLAKKKCPELVVIPPDYNLYAKTSNQMAALLGEYSPLIKRFSIDECFLDFSGMEKCMGEPLAIAEEMRSRMKNELGFTVNIGIGNNILLAKMASEMEKPDKIHTLLGEEYKEKMWPLPVGELFMLGRKTATVLHNFGIYTIGQLAAMPLDTLQNILGKENGNRLHFSANGIASDIIVPNGLIPIKSFSNSTTVPNDITDPYECYSLLMTLCDTVSNRMRNEGFSAKVISVEIKRKNFECVCRQKSIYTHVCSLSEIYEEAFKILDSIWSGEPIRAMCVRLSDLNPDTFIQSNLFYDKKTQSLEKLDRVSDKIKKTYGRKSIMRCVSLTCPYNLNESELHGIAVM